MTTMPVPVIDKWSVHHDGGWLIIEVRFPSPAGRMTFVRLQWDTSGNPLTLTRVSVTDESKRRWVWAQMSGERPIVRVDESGWEVLDQAVKQHPVLMMINNHWGILE